MKSFVIAALGRRARLESFYCETMIRASVLMVALLCYTQATATSARDSLFKCASDSAMTTALLKHRSQLAGLAATSGVQRDTSRPFLFLGYVKISSSAVTGGRRKIQIFFLR